MTETALTIDVYVTPLRPYAGSPAQGPGDDPNWSPMSSTLIAGEEEAILVDALIANDQVDALAEWVRGFGKRLTGVYITHSWAAISWLVHPSRASLAIWASWAVRSVKVSTVRLRTVSPVTSSSRRARSAKPSMPIAVSIWYEARSCSRDERRDSRPRGQLELMPHQATFARWGPLARGYKRPLAANECVGDFWPSICENTGQVAVIRS